MTANTDPQPAPGAALVVVDEVQQYLGGLPDDVLAGLLRQARKTGLPAVELDAARRVQWPSLELFGRHPADRTIQDQIGGEQLMNANDDRCGGCGEPIGQCVCDARRVSTTAPAPTATK